MTRAVGVEQRRARLGRRHGLAAGFAGPIEAAAAMVALHATDPGTVFLSALVRAPGTDIAAIEAALYTDRALVRMLSMRRTVWVTPRDTAPVLQAACTRDVAAVQRKRLLLHLDVGTDLADPPSWLAAVEQATVAAITERGEATAAELVSDVPDLRTRITVPGQPASQNATSRVLLLLSADGHMVRGRPLGSWLSTQYRWSPTTVWWDGGMPQLDADVARAELARRWLATFGPAPASDLQWWAGWTVARTKAALAAAGAVAVTLDGGPGVALAEDLDDEPEPEPWVALLPGLDPTPMGWQARDWFLGPHKEPLFDRSGNIGPTLWSDGRIVGGWAHRADGTIALRLLEDVGAEVRAAIEAAAERLAARIGPGRVTPRFRTPLEKELSA
ncbi:winged helix DNA-binding domain-containing protein [Pseudonocardia sp. GCM10023141]|uniref:winged helix DNA-binding domain-containing protein n=1 Tax=Pseudonocardia sp. GCM10023141 TaxID=3252653 RepID=UPI00361008E0